MAQSKSKRSGGIRNQTRNVKKYILRKHTSDKKKKRIAPLLSRWNNKFKYYKSASVITLIWLSFNNLVHIPSPATNVSENVPSNIFPQPHEGDFDLKITSLHHISLASSKTFWAPAIYSSVISSPLIVFTRPSGCISACCLGVDNHHNSSGHKGIASWFFTNWIICWQGFALPFHLQGIPAKQELTILIIHQKK